AKRNVLLAHLFVTGAARCESEELNVGGADNVEAGIFAPFDYVAMGHLHGAQNAGKDTIRYCGSPLKYSFSETAHKKSVSIVELAQKGSITVKEIPLVPKRDMREIRGKYLEVASREFYRYQNTGDYLRVTLTDEDDQPDAIKKLRVIYPNIMKLDYDNKRTRTKSSVAGTAGVSRFTPLQLFEMLFKEQNGQAFSEIQKDFLDDLIGQVWGAGQ
ncbi:MAG: exonuclease SbcCD subunit D C-terminal domain-containing protein, partial [Clostridiales bacterium]|nr:exonuclease SbcCD subunit D C-terminal domain-containing protein [Clostridiales bacterium]